MVKQAAGFVSGTWARSEDGTHGQSLLLFESQEAAKAAVERAAAGPPPGAPVTVLRGVRGARPGLDLAPGPPSPGGERRGALPSDNAGSAARHRSASSPFACLGTVTVASRNSPRLGSDGCWPFRVGPRVADVEAAATFCTVREPRPLRSDEPSAHQRRKVTRQISAPQRLPHQGTPVQAGSG
jgi:hypothetical protein